MSAGLSVVPKGGRNAGRRILALDSSTLRQAEGSVEE
jgi:hypothetical protein